MITALDIRNENRLSGKYSDEWLKAQSKTLLPIEKLDTQLLVLQTAFPTIVRNYDKMEFAALRQLWYDIFKNVPEDLMNEAVRRFIINDRKGFFPSPGQIVGCIESIVREREMQKILLRCYGTSAKDEPKEANG